MSAKPAAKRKKKGIGREDHIAEAGRKIFARQLRRMRQFEAGSRSGADIEDLHEMRVAIRRMRSLFNLIGERYRPKTAVRFQRGLRDTARVLGAIRDLDVLIIDLEDYAAGQPEAAQAIAAAVIASLDQRRRAHRARLNKYFDSKRYRRFVRDFRRFCKRRGQGARRVKRRERPHQVRHLLPLLLHGRLARVKAYAAVLPASEDTVLHALRVEFKQLRYAVEFFQPLLGVSAGRFLGEVKAMQDSLGRINDIAVFTEYMAALDGMPPEQEALVAAYIADRLGELAALRRQFELAWARFNRRATQSQFAESLLVLR